MDTTKLSFDQIVKKLNDNNINIRDVAYGDFDGGYDIGPSVLIEQVGGEDCGIEWYVVRHFTYHDVYMKIDASYYSYDGVDFDNSTYIEVKPTEVTKIEYLPVKK